MNTLPIENKFVLYMKLMRLHKPIGTLLLLWPTLWALWIAAGGWPGWQLAAIFCIGTLLMRSAGCVMNDLADVRFDAETGGKAQNGAGILRDVGLIKRDPHSVRFGPGHDLGQ